MTETSMTGRCLCGAVRYRSGPLLYPATLCHCESCRRASGAHVVAWATVGIDGFEYTTGKPVDYSSSLGVIRQFCGRCGTPLTFRRADRATEVDIGVATFDRPSAGAPVDHVWMEDALPWDRPSDGLPQHPRGRGD